MTLVDQNESAKSGGGRQVEGARKEHDSLQRFLENCVGQKRPKRSTNEALQELLGRPGVGVFIKLFFVRDLRIFVLS